MRDRGVVREEAKKSTIATPEASRPPDPSTPDPPTADASSPRLLIGVAVVAIVALLVVLVLLSGGPT